ncbi:MAG: rhomboid family intramembrane serine protease, partial [Verrucomicrobiota bacterium]
VSPRWHTAGIMDSEAFRAGEWWRLFTAVMLHGDAGHLMANITTGFLLLGLAMARFGGGVTLLATFLAGVLGNIAGLLIYSGPYRALGASGMMMGALGLLAAQSVADWRANPRAARAVLASLIAGIMLFLLFGASPTSDLVGHVVGFLAGTVGGAALSHLPEATLHRARTRGLALAALMLAVLLPWLLAWRT